MVAPPIQLAYIATYGYRDGRSVQTSRSDILFSILKRYAVWSAVVLPLAGVLTSCGGGNSASSASNAPLTVNAAAIVAAPENSPAVVVKAQVDIPKPVAAYMRQATDASESKQERARTAGLTEEKARQWSLPALSEADHAAALAAMAASLPGTPRQIATGRTLDSAKNSAAFSNTLVWQQRADGTRFAVSKFSSAGATGLRLGVLIDRLPAEAQLVFYTPGAGRENVFTGADINSLLAKNRAAGDLSDAGRTFWSPYVAGENAVMEVELPSGADTKTIAISVGLISHFFDSPLAAADELTPKIGEAATCNIDVSCQPASLQQANAVARMVYTKENGGSSLCSGTLLNDRAVSGTPYFLSANHCISKQTVASTLQTFWFYRSSSCNSGSLSASSVSRSGGATLLYASSLTDTSFLQLSQLPPAGAVYAGWSPSGLTSGLSVAGIHHPRGDLQKISFGNVTDYQACQVTNSTTGGFSCSTGSSSSAGFFNVRLTSGTTEGGSSGSGIFANTSGGPALIGQLYGGSSSCSNPSGSNIYGRFDAAYNAGLSRWLEGSAAASNYALTVSRQGNGSGSVVSSPAGISCGSTCATTFAAGTNVLLTATPASGSSFAGWSGACSGTGNCSVSMSTARSVVASFSAPQQSLGTALDNPNQAFSSGGSIPFFAQALTFNVGGSSTQSGRISDSQNSTLASVFTGPGILSFDWKVSSEASYDFLSVSLDGVQQARLSGDSAWISSVINIPAGAHTVQWSYAKDFSLAGGVDAGWVDNVRFIASANAVNAAQNGGFESGTQNWVQTPGIIVDRTSTSPVFAGGGSRLAWLCGYNNCNDTLYQDMTLPAGNASVLVQLSYFISTQEQSLTTAYDYMSVQVRSLTQPALQATAAIFSNLDAASTWRSLVADISQFAGHTIRLIFTALSDASLSSSFYVDNVSVMTSAGSNTAPTTGWWWNASEPGRGFSIEKRDNKIFLAGFYYETTGAAAWSVSTLTQQADGSYSGVLERYVGGQVLGGAFRTATGIKLADVVLRFSTASVGTLRIQAVSGTTTNIALQRFPISTPAAFATSAASFESGWWWNEAEPGRGYFIEVQGTQAFISIFGYESSGQAVWYVANANLGSPSAMSASLLRYAAGQSLQGAHANPVSAASPGSVGFQFASPTTGTLTLPDGSRTNIRRFVF